MCHHYLANFEIGGYSKVVKLKQKLKDKIKSDNPATNAISLDGWSENHEGLDSIF